MVWAIFGLLLVFWVLGIIGNVGGQFIHLLLIVAGAVLIFKLIAGGRTVA